jgi:S1-C subfamily serine protease
VIDGARSIAISFQGGEPISASVLRTSEATDIAVLYVDRPTTDFVAIGAVHSARTGMPVFTIGFPALWTLGIEPKFTDGTISALSGLRDEAAFLQTTTPVQPGNSGGPLVDDQGEVVGVIIGRAADEVFMNRYGSIPQNINFASKAENLVSVLDRAIATRKPTGSRRQAIDRAIKAVCLIFAGD